MYDMLPFPNITATDTKEQVAQINNYLIQFKETLEFILTNISADNLSADLIAKLNDLGSDIQKRDTERGEELQQVSGRIITASDVVNSAVYKADMDLREEKIQKEHDADVNALNAEIAQVSSTHQADIKSVRAEIKTVSDTHATDKASLETQISNVSKAHQTDIALVNQEIQSVSDRVLTIPEIVNSEEYQADMDVMEAEIQRKVEAKVPTASDVVNAMDLRVNYDTGHLEY